MTPLQQMKPEAGRSSGKLLEGMCSIHSFVTVPLCYGSFQEMHDFCRIREYGWEAIGWLKPTSFHCVIRLVGVCVSEGERDPASVTVCV